MRRYVFYAGVCELSVLGESMRQEIWLGVESDSDVDLAEFSRAHGYHLIPSEHFTAAELASIGVTKFVRLEDYAEDGEPA